MTETKLTYLVQPRPSPFLTGQVGTLAIVISDLSDDPIRIKSIFISLSAGTGPNDLSEDLSKVKAAKVPGWTVKSNDGSFTLTPDGGFVDMTAGGFVLVIPNINVNSIPGACEVMILEETEVDGQTVRAPKRVPIAKVSPDLAIEFFDAVPASFKPGESVVLSWNGSAQGTYVIKYPDHEIDHIKDQEDPLPNHGSYSIDNLDEDTTFQLELTYGGQKLKRQVMASIERAKVETFTVDNPNPMYGQPVRLDWDVLAEEFEIIHDGVSLKKVKCDTVGTLKGHMMVTPDKPDALYTLTATAGETTDQDKAQVAVRVPEVTIDVDNTALTYGQNPVITWGFKNRWQGTVELEAVGARTKKSYFKKVLGDQDGKNASLVSNQIAPFDVLGYNSTAFDLGVGEGLILTAKTPWFAREEPVEATKTLTFDGVQDLRPDIDYPSLGSYAGTISERANAITSNDFYKVHGMVKVQLMALAAEFGVAADKVIGAERWSIPFIIYGDGIKAVSLRINAWGGDEEWKRLWFEGIQSDPIGGSSRSIAPWYKSNNTKFRGSLSLFAPKAMLDDALMALHFTVGGKGMNVSWNATGDKYLRVNAK